jgi:hypothetical protein
MKNNLLNIVNQSKNLLSVQRAKRALRIRYGLVFPKKPANDPIWLSVY